MFFFSCFTRFSLILSHTCRLGGFRLKLGSACEEFEDSKDGFIGLMFLRVLVPAQPGCPELMAIKQLLLLCVMLVLYKMKLRLHSHCVLFKSIHRYKFVEI